MLADLGISGVIDTNVLVYAHDKASEHEEASFRLLEDASNGQQRLAVTPQILMEFYSIITDRRRTPIPLSSSEAMKTIDVILDFRGITLLPYPTDLIDRVKKLLNRNPVTGPGIYDLQIVATMLGNDVTTIFTFNRKDFVPFHELTVKAPGTK